MAPTLPTWSGVTLRGSSAGVRVKASMHDGACQRKRWLDAHPNVSATPSSPGGSGPVVVGEVADLIVAALRQPRIDEHAPRSAWIRSQLGRYSDRHRIYLEHATETLIDLSLYLDEVHGPFTSRGLHASWTAPSGSELYAWALYFEGPGGLREARRIRMGSARGVDEQSRLWALHAARAVAGDSGQWRMPCERVVVREVGAYDGSDVVVLDIGRAELEGRYAADLRPALLSMLAEHDATPGFGCADCRIAPTCGALISADGMLGVTARASGRRRSIAASDLELHDRCPSRWYFERELHLPKETALGDAAARGIAVHAWLRHAHARGVPCALSDLPDSADAQGWIAPSDYEMALPFLVQHVADCPLAVPGTSVLAHERTFHLFDAMANAVVAIKPDLVLQRGTTLVIVETKSSETVPVSSSRSEISSRYMQVNVLLCAAEALAASFGCNSATVELELVTASAWGRWSWDAGTALELSVARSDVGGRATSLLTDTAFDPRPGPLCISCSVRQWCASRDAYDPSTASATGVNNQAWTPGEPF